MRAFRFACLLCLAAFSVQAQDQTDETIALPEPEGPVVLTVSGALEAANRGPLDEFADALLAGQDAGFERAVAFDRAMLERLGVQRFEVNFPDWPEPYRVSGPALSDVLRRAGAVGETTTLHAVNGFSVALSRNALEARQAIVALRANGRWLDVGGRGPAWIVYPNDGSPDDTPENVRPVWGVVRIAVE